MRERDYDDESSSIPRKMTKEEEKAMQMRGNDSIISEMGVLEYYENHQKVVDKMLESLREIKRNLQDDEVEITGEKSREQKDAEGKANAIDLDFDPRFDRGGGTQTFPVELDMDTRNIDLMAEDEGDKALVPFETKLVVRKGEMSKSLNKLSKVHRKLAKVESALEKFDPDSTLLLKYKPKKSDSSLTKLEDEEAKRAILRRAGGKNY